MFDIGMQELLVILVVVLILFGPRRLPEIGRSIGKALRELKRTTRDFQDAIDQEPPEETRKEVEKKLSRDISSEEDREIDRSGKDSCSGSG